VSSGSLGATTSGVAAAFGVAFLDFALVALAGSFADFGVDVPFVVFGVFNLILGFLADSLRCRVCAWISIAFADFRE